MKCANCGITQGPFMKVYDGGPAVCKNTKAAPTRLADCVARREKTHAQAEREKYM